MDKKMVKNNGSGKNLQKASACSEEERENIRLKKVLQRAVLKENAPESLREAIRKMIRQ